MRNWQRSASAADADAEASRRRGDVGYRREVKRAVRLALSSVTVSLVVTMVAGCGGSGPQAQQPPPLKSLLAKPSRSPVVPPPSAAVIKSAVEAFVDGLNQALRTGDISAAQQASTSTCNCRSELTKIADVYDKHAKFVGTNFVVIRIVATSLAPGTSKARVVVRVAPGAIENAKGKKHAVKGHPAQSVIFTLTDEGGRWLVSSVADSSGKTPTPPKKKPTPKPSPSR